MAWWTNTGQSDVHRRSAQRELRTRTSRTLWPRRAKPHRGRRSGGCRRAHRLDDRSTTTQSKIRFETAHRHIGTSAHRHITNVARCDRRQRRRIGHQRRHQRSGSPRLRCRPRHLRVSGRPRRRRPDPRQALRRVCTAQVAGAAQERREFRRQPEDF